MFGKFGFVVTIARLLIINLRQTEELNCAGQKALSGARRSSRIIETWKETAKTDSFQRWAIFN